ncbi:hypothetical protein PC128_g12670 [Phytophthora cactorum]|nr:hypothetical protein PC128_g12670 [Phytophthora cactorum]
MTIKSIPIRNSLCDILLATVVLLICVDVALGATDLKTTSASFETSRHILYTDLDVIRAYRRLRTTVSDANDDYEYRGFIGITKMKDLTQAGTKKLQKVAEGVNNKLTSNNQHTANKLFTKFMVDKVESNLLTSKPFDDWTQAVTKAYKNDDEAAYAAIFTTLAGSKTDEALVSMLAATDSIRTSILKLREVQLNKWMTSRKSEDDVYQLLQIDATASDLMKSPALSMWMAYMSKLKEDPYDFLLQKLTPSYGEAGLAKMLAKSKDDAATREIAEKMETLLLKKWLESDKTMIDVFQLLKLNTRPPDTLLLSPVLSTWAAYTIMLKKDPYELLFLAIKRTGLDDAGLARMIGIAEQYVNTAPTAKKMQELQFKKWKKDGKSAANVFRLIGLNKEDDKLFESPVWNTWLFYLDYVDKATAHKEMISILRAQFGDERLTNIIAKAKEVDSTKEIATKMERGIWLASGKTSDEIFDFLKLNEKMDDVYESAAFKTWVAYVKELNGLRKYPDEFVVITQLEKRYGGVELARMLARVKKERGTNQLLGELQGLQFKKLMAQGIGPIEMAAKSRPKDPIDDTVYVDFERYMHSRNNDLYEPPP